MILKLALLFLGALWMLPARAGQYVESLSYVDLQSSSYRGYLAGARLDDKRVTESWDLSAGLGRLQRTFPDQTKFTELNYQLGAVYRYDKQIYIESSIDHAPNADILPLYSVLVTPHWVVGNGDFGLGANFRKYKTVQSGYLNPSYFTSVNSFLALAGGLYFVRTEHYLTAYHGAVILTPTNRQSLRFDISTGKTLEDAGVEATFDSWSLEYGYRWNHFALYGSYGDYRSQIRTEKAYGLRLEFR